MRKNKHQALLYCLPNDPYFEFILLKLLVENIRLFPDADHIIYPIYGTRVYSSLASKYPRFLKKSVSFVNYMQGEVRLFLRAKQLVGDYVSASEFKRVKFVNPYQWSISLITSMLKVKVIDKYKNDCVDAFIDRFKINEVPAGDLLVDTYLRYKGSAVVDLDHWFFKDIVWRGFAIEQIHRKLLHEYKKVILFGSYTSYIDHGIGIRLLCKKNHTSITFGSRKTPYQVHRNLLSQQLPRHEGYHEQIYPIDAIKLSKTILLKAEESLINRCNQNYDRSMSYMQNAPKNLDSGYERDNIPGSILLMLHDFFDSVHGYRWVIFPDFYQWADATISFCVKNNITINIKPHPNQRPESEQVIKKLASKYSSSKCVHWIQKTALNSELFALNPSLLVTVYGSVVAEAAFQGIRVLLAGDYPGINFKIGKVMTNKQTYFECISTPSLVDKPLKSHAILFNACLFKNSFEKKYCSLYEFLGINNIGVSDLKALMESDEAKSHLDKIISKLHDDLKY